MTSKVHGKVAEAHQHEIEKLASGHGSPASKPAHHQHKLDVCIDADSSLLGVAVHHALGGTANGIKIGSCGYDSSSYYVCEDKTTGFVGEVPIYGDKSHTRKLPATVELGSEKHIVCTKDVDMVFY